MNMNGIGRSDFEKLERFFREEKIRGLPVEIGEFAVADLGIACCRGNYRGVYHKFKVTYKEQSHIFYISPLPNNKGDLLLIVSPAGDNIRLLQLNLTKFANRIDNKLRIDHDGRMAIDGRKIENSRTIAAVKKNFRELIDSEGKIFLGEIVMDKDELKFEDMSEFLVRLFKYLFVRAELKEVRPTICGPS